jgi:hypothetical protein
MFMPQFNLPIEAPDKAGTKGSVPQVIFFDDFTDGLGFTANNPAIASSQGKFSELANMGQWLATVVDGGSDSGEVITCTDDAHGGAVTLTTNDADNDSIECQLNGEAFALSAGRNIVFETRMKGTDVSEFDWFFGLSITDTTVMTAASDRIGFECADSTGDIDAISEKDAAQTTTDTTSNLADATYVVLRLEISGTSEARYYVDGELKATHTTNLPDDEAMTPTMCIRNDGAAANTMHVDYIYVAADR